MIITTDIFYIWSTIDGYSGVGKASNHSIQKPGYSQARTEIKIPCVLFWLNGINQGPKLMIISYLFKWKQ